MDPSKLRTIAAVAWVVLLADLVFFSAPRSPERPEADGPVVDARRTELSDRTPKRDSTGATRPAVPAEPVAVGEPADRAVLIRTTSGPSGPPRGSFAAAYPAQARATRTTGPGGNFWALIIGINDYAGSTRDNIGSYQDATALRTHLLGLGWRSDHVLLIGNRSATRTRIIQGLQWLASKTDGASTVVFHYSGHERPYSSDVDGDGESRDVALWAADNKLIVDGDLGTMLGAVRAGKMWLNFAVCRAGGFDDPGTVKPGRLITYSSPEWELSYEDPAVGHSVFGYFSIVEGMRSQRADANGDELTTVQEAFAYARPRVINRTSNRQHPSMVDSYGRSFSLVAGATPSGSGGSAQPSPAPSPCTIPIGCEAKPEDRY